MNNRWQIVASIENEYTVIGDRTREFRDLAYSLLKGLQGTERGRMIDAALDQLIDAADAFDCAQQYLDDVTERRPLSELH